MDEIKVTCQCGRVLAAPASLAGKNVRCPACGFSFIIPSPAPEDKNVIEGLTPVVHDSPRPLPRKFASRSR